MQAGSDIPVWRKIGPSPPPANPRQRVPILIIGAGPVGLTAALDLGRRGHEVVVLNRLEFVAAGSKAICFAKRTLDIWNRLGVGDAIVEKGVIWNEGKVFWGDDPEPIYQFDMLPVKKQKMPGFVNIQQYHVEDRLLWALEAFPNVDIRWGHELIGIQAGPNGAWARTVCQAGSYNIDADWVLACDGAKSPTRTLMGLAFEGRVFEDNFLIADIRMAGERPSERWFWFDPPFNRGRSALLHRQPDNVWRLDFQMGRGIDREACIKPEYVANLIRGMLGQHVEFCPEWYSIYTFECRRMARFVHGPVIFAGDSAHLVSPFGARGCNGGIADIDNLVWKLDLVLRGLAQPGLLESYNYEAIVAAEENILNSSRSTDFMTPKCAASIALRDAVLELARDHSFARPFVNSGRLSAPVSYPDSPLNTLDEAEANWRSVAPGSPAVDAPTADGWLLDTLGGDFVLLGSDFHDGPDGIRTLDVNLLGDVAALIEERYDLKTGSACLVRPDQYVAARWRAPTRGGVERALRRAMGDTDE